MPQTSHYGPDHQHDRTDEQEASAQDTLGRPLDFPAMAIAVPGYLREKLQLTAAETGAVVRELFEGPLVGRSEKILRAAYGNPQAIWRKVDKYIHAHPARKTDEQVIHGSVKPGKQLAGKQQLDQHFGPRENEMGSGHTTRNPDALYYAIPNHLAREYDIASKEEARKLADQIFGEPMTVAFLGKLGAEEAWRLVDEFDASVVSGNTALPDLTKDDSDMSKTAAAPTKPAVDPEVARQAALKGQWKALINRSFPQDNLEDGGALMLEALNWHLSQLDEPTISKLSEWPFDLDLIEDVITDWRAAPVDEPEDSGATGYDDPAAYGVPPRMALHSEALATCYPSDNITYKGFRFNISLRSGGKFADCMALMDEYIAAHNAGIIKLTPVGAAPAGNAKQGTQGASSSQPAPATPKPANKAAGGADERDSLMFTSVTRNVVNNKSTFSLGYDFKPGKPSKFPHNITKDYDLEAFLKDLAAAGGENYASMLEPGFVYTNITGEMSWTQGKEYEPGKYYRDNLRFKFNLPE